MIKMPKSKVGKWSLGLGLAFVVLMALSLLIAFNIGGDPTVIEGNTLFSILVLILNATLNLSGLLSLVLGIFTIIKYKEWSICVSLAVLYVLATLMFVLGEFLFPH